MRGILAENPKVASIADHQDGIGTYYARRAQAWTWMLST